MRNQDPNRKQKIHVDDERRVVVIGTPEGLDGMTDAEIVVLLKRASQLRAQFKAAGYIVTWETEHKQWREPPRDDGN